MTQWTTSIRLAACVAIVLTAATILTAEDLPPGTDTAEPPPVPQTFVGKQGLTLADIDQQLSYMIGYHTGANLANLKVRIDYDLVLKGFQDGATEQPTFSPTQRQKMMRLVYQRMSETQSAHLLELRAQAKEYLDANRQKPGVVVTPSGLQYRVIAEGDGPTPTAENTVLVNFAARLISGKEFDTSYPTGKPFRVAVNALIPGWSEAIKMMKKGAHWEITIPPSLAYGDRGAGEGRVPPVAVVIMDLELVDVE